MANGTVLELMTNNEDLIQGSLDNALYHMQYIEIAEDGQLLELYSIAYFDLIRAINGYAAFKATIEIVNDEATTV